MATPVEIVQQYLANLTAPDVVHALVAEDATYVSLNDEDAELKKILPWAGTSRGPDAFMDTFTRVFQYWDARDFRIDEAFGEGERVAVFGHFTLTSKTLGKTTSSPFAVFARVRDGKIVQYQFLEDSFATASTFRAGGTWQVHNDPAGQAFEI